MTPPRERPTTSVERKRLVAALAGRPNTGKSTLFNALTGLRQRAANFAGCTVEKAEGVLSHGGREIEVVDLPGTFSILPATEDELVALRFLSEAAADDPGFAVFCAAEASNLQNDLPLAISLRDCGYRVRLAVNMIDEAAFNGIRVDAAELSKRLRMPVFLISARHGDGLDALKTALATDPGPKESPASIPIDFRGADETILKAIHREAVKEAADAVAHSVAHAYKGPPRTISTSIRLDRWLFHPAAGPAILAAVLFLVFEALFVLGAPLRDAIAQGLLSASGALRPLIASPLLSGLLCDGIIAGISAVATFIPQIAILFALIGFLEQSGYLPRAGAMVDRALRPFGLDGKVFIPFLSSFACAIPGVMATRTISNEKKRLSAILLCPLMTCSARVPVYTLIIAAFVPASFKILGLNAQAVVMGGMYAFGIVMALALALVLRAAAFGDAKPSSPTVLPPYRFPKPKELVRYVWIRCWHFLSKAGKVIFVLSVILWAMGSFPKNRSADGAIETQITAINRLTRSSQNAGRLAELKGREASLDLEYSLLGRLGRAVEPVFKPIGYDWRLSVAVLSSVAAREVFVGTLGTIFALDQASVQKRGLVEALRAAKTPDGAARYTIATAVSLLIFFAIALQCVSTIAIVRRETGGWKWPAIQFALFFILAYSLSWAGYHLAARFLT